MTAYLFLHSRQPGFRRFSFVTFGADVVGGDDQVISIHQFDLGAPAPVGSASGIGVIASNGKTILFCRANAKHDSRVVVPAIHPTGFVLI